MNIRRVEYDEASRFIFNSSITKDLKAIYIEASTSEKDKSISVFTQPKDSILKKHWTTELIYTSDSKTIEESLKFFIEELSPSDILINRKISTFLSSSFLKQLKKLEYENDYYVWINPNRTYYTYRITATDSDKYYYGASHIKKSNATVQDCNNDGYFGSGGGSSKRNKFSNWKRKHYLNLKKETIAVFQTSKEAYKHEKELIGDKYKTDPLCLNSTSGGKDGGLSYRFNTTKLKNCQKHGIVNHFGDRCYKCNAESRYTIKSCIVHGESKHTKKGCLKCSLSKAISNNECSVHGVTVFKGKSCVKCVNSKSLSEKYCTIHGVAKHIGERCYSCIDYNYNEKYCTVHGDTKFRGDSCAKCISENTSIFKNCNIHGLSKHRGDNCDKCTVRNTKNMKECPEHGLVSHQGASCCVCTSKKAIHTRDHLNKGKKVNSCVYCE